MERYETQGLWWEYEQLPSGEPYAWHGDSRGDRPDDQVDFHLDLGCGRLKKGRLGIDRFADKGVDLLMDLDRLMVDPATDPEKLSALHKPYPQQSWSAGLPFPDASIESIISSHAFEHVGDGFIRLMDECYRVLKPGGLLRVIVPLFPSHAAVADPDHKRYFVEGTFRYFAGDGRGGSWQSCFSTPYTRARFHMPDHRGSYTNPDCSPPPANPLAIGSEADQREMRVSLFKPE